MARTVALVTGASSGLGTEYARLAARDGHDVILVARREAQLEALGKELALAHGIAAHPVVADLNDPSAPQRLFDEVVRRGLQVEVLVNNAGFGSNGHFLDLPLEREAGMVEVNVQALLKLCWLFGRGMRERKQGRILNVASTAGFQPLPYEAVYAASKAFAVNFSDALHMEVRGAGVEVLAVNPGPVPTEWQQVAGLDGVPKGMPLVSAEQVVRESIDAAQKGKRSIVPGRGMRWAMAAATPAPRTLKLRVMERANRPGSNLRYR